MDYVPILIRDASCFHLMQCKKMHLCYNIFMAFRQIIGSFEDIGKDIIRETARIPSDIAGIAPKRPDKPQEKPAPPQNPRAALEYFAGSSRRKPSEPDVFEKQNQEEEQRKQRVALQQKFTEISQLKKISTKRGRGDRFGIHAKQTAVEKRATGQD